LAEDSTRLTEVFIIHAQTFLHNLLKLPRTERCQSRLTRHQVNVQSHFQLHEGAVKIIA
jgi:hypothetical protein